MKVNTREKKTFDIIIRKFADDPRAPTESKSIALYGSGEYTAAELAEFIKTRINCK